MARLCESEVQAHIPRAIAIMPYIIQEAKQRKGTLSDWEVIVPLCNLEPSTYGALLHLMRISWHSRVWVIQEAALAADLTFLCGTHIIDGTLLEDAVYSDTGALWKALDNSRQVADLAAFSVTNLTTTMVRSLVQGGGRSLSSETPGLLLRVSRLLNGQTYCFLAQDRVFGILGLVEDEDLSVTVADLQKSESISTLYNRFSRYILLNNSPNETQYWWPFFNSSFTLHRREGLPSWVPDFHYQEDQCVYVCLPQSIAEFPNRKVRYIASGREMVVRSGSRMAELILRGKVLDELRVIHPVGVRKWTKEESENALWLARLLGREASVAERVLHLDKSECASKERAECCCVTEEIY